MALTSDDAFDLSESIRGIAVALGDYRFKTWDSLSPKDRQALEDAEWSLLDASSNIRTQAVGLVLDETQTSVAKLKATTAKARKAIKTINDVKKGIAIAAATIALAGAIASKDPGAIAKAAKGLYDAATA